MGLIPASEVRKLITPFSADEPYNTDDAPLIISICERFSMGRNCQRIFPASDDKAGKPSINANTRLPAP